MTAVISPAPATATSPVPVTLEQRLWAREAIIDLEGHLCDSTCDARYTARESVPSVQVRAQVAVAAGWTDPTEVDHAYTVAAGYVEGQARAAGQPTGPAVAALHTLTTPSDVITVAQVKDLVRNVTKSRTWTGRLASLTHKALTPEGQARFTIEADETSPSVLYVTDKVERVQVHVYGPDGDKRRPITDVEVQEVFTATARAWTRNWEAYRHEHRIKHAACKAAWEVATGARSVTP